MKYDELFKTTESRKRMHPDMDNDESNEKEHVGEDERIARLVDSAESLKLDLASVKKMALRFEKACRLNQQQRSKFLNEPERWVESEADLDSEIKQLTVLAGAPELYPDIISLGFGDSVLSLLSHENTDIANSALELLSSLTDQETVDTETPEATTGLETLLKYLVHYLSYLYFHESGG